LTRVHAHFARVHKADAVIVQKDEIAVVRSARIDLPRKSEPLITLLPDC